VSTDFDNQNLNSLNDNQLIKEIKVGNQGAFAILVKKHASKFYAVAFRILGNQTDAEDIIQDLFLKLWKTPDIWQEGRGAKFSTWFYRIITNKCIDFQRKKKPDQILEGYDVVDNSNLEEDLDTIERKKMIEKMLQELPERQRIAISLCFYEGFSNQEAAEIMQLNIKALESLLMRAKKTLKNKVLDFDKINKEIPV
jgi:RNA polymerase sigma-70 factor (ECF subfamily)